MRATNANDAVTTGTIEDTKPIPQESGKWSRFWETLLRSLGAVCC
ncbi:hypothetical protein BH11PLA2_BH11PLA2_40740 [soil metagenome]